MLKGQQKGNKEGMGAQAQPLCDNELKTITEKYWLAKEFPPHSKQNR